MTAVYVVCVMNSKDTWGVDSAWSTLSEAEEIARSMDGWVIRVPFNCSYK